ncbi:MAG: hypothetical protein JNM72_13195 [Deltaproteobacteria bacterium]|jgi:hypothetical protein|nr:hypothetical protein [Deltaproteobacteria bacterium]
MAAPPRSSPALRWAALIALGACAADEKPAPADPAEGPALADLVDADAVGDACAQVEGQRTAVTVRFPATDGPCPFGEADNDRPDQGQVTARVEAEVQLPLPEGAVLCGLELDFAGGAGWEGSPMRYDDAFLLSFSGAVLVSSDVELVDRLPVDGVLPLYDWQALRGAPLAYERLVPWCVGEAEGLSDCAVPPPEDGGLLALGFAQALVNELSYQALDRGPLRFGMVTLGDNDDSDCSHDELAFEVRTRWITLP